MSSDQVSDFGFFVLFNKYEGKQVLSKLRFEQVAPLTNAKTAPTEQINLPEINLEISITISLLL